MDKEKPIEPLHINEVLYDECKKCNKICSAIHFRQNFINWTSGNDNIDKFIQDSQLLVHDNYKLSDAFLEWIPYHRLNDIKYITKGGFVKTYRANWIDGNIHHWNIYSQNWIRVNQNMIVELKRLNNLKNFTLEFMNEV